MDEEKMFYNAVALAFDGNPSSVRISARAARRRMEKRQLVDLDMNLPMRVSPSQAACGLARGVLIVECPQRSGSLATAMYAREQNRDLFVVPGPIAHPNFFGSHQLIRQGAILVTKPEEILEEYDIDVRVRATREGMAATPEEKQVLLALREAAAPLDVDKIIELAKLEPRVVSRALTFLLLKNLIKETEAGYIIE